MPTTILARVSFGFLLLSVALLTAGAQTCDDPKCTRYIDCLSGSKGNDGSKDAPYSDFSEAVEWVDNLAGSCDCLAELIVSPCNYTSDTLRARSPLLIRSTQRLAVGSKEPPQVRVEVNNGSFANAIDTTLIISDVTFYGKQDALPSVDQPLIKVIGRGASFNLTRAAFLFINRTASLVVVESSNTTLFRVYAEGCNIDLTRDSVWIPYTTPPSGLIIVSDALLLSIDSSTFRRNQLLLSSAIGLSPSGGSCLHAAYCHEVFIGDSTFGLNSVIFIPPPPLHPLPSNDTSQAQTFEHRSSASLPKERHVLHGGAILFTDSRIILITDSILDSNSLSLPFGLGTTYGGSISVLNSLRFNLVNFNLASSRADIGGGIYLGFIYLMRPLPFVGFSAFDTSHVVGNRCTRFGCGIAIESASEIEMYVHHTNFHSNMLDTSKELVEGLIGGAAAAFVVSAPEPLESILEISTVTTTLNSFASDLKTPEGGVVFLIDGVLHITVQNTVFRTDVCGASCLWIRRFRDLLWDYCIFDSVFNLGVSERFPYIDIGTDYQFYLAPDNSVTFRDCNFTNIQIDLIKISNIASVLIQNAFIGNRPQGFDAVGWPIRSLDFQEIRSHVEIKDSVFLNPGGVNFKSITRIQMTNCYMERSSTVPAMDSPWLITTTSCPLMRYQYCTFDMKGYNGVLKSVLALVIFQHSIVKNGHVPTLGGGVFHDQGSLLVLNTTMDNCTATYGGAIFSQGVDLSLQVSTFSNNHATLEGGAIRASTFLRSRSTTFRSNSVDLASGRGGAIYVGPATSTFIETGSAPHPATRLRASEPVPDLRRGAIEETLDEPLDEPLGEPTDDTPIEPWSGCPITQHFTVIVSGSTFATNAAAYGGAVWIDSTGLNINEESVFVSNNATIHGGAIGAVGAQLLIVSSNFTSNYASPNVPFANLVPSMSLIPEPLHTTRPAHDSNVGTGLLPDFHGLGGAIFASKTSACLYSTDFSKNAAERSGGALVLDEPYDVDMKNLKLEENVAFSGGALTLYGSSTDCTTNMRDLRVRLNGAHYGGAFRLSSGCETMLLSSIFEGNWAVSSGGAMYVSNDHNLYPKYSGLQFIDNSAGVSGGTFFHNVHLLRFHELAPPLKFCSAALCNITSNPLNTRYKPTWGPVWAGSGWKVSSTQLIPITVGSSKRDEFGFSTVSLSSSASNEPLRSVESSNGPSKLDTHLSLYVRSYKLRLTLEDYYGQEPAGVYPIQAAASYGPRNSSHPSPYTLTIGALGMNEILFSVTAANITRTGPHPYTRPGDVEKSMKPEEMKLYFGLKPIFGDSFSWFRTAYEMALTTTQYNCPAGEGLYEANSLNAAKCRVCPTNSYNIDGDGYCYSCNGPEQPPGSACEGSHVSFLAGHWSGTPPNKNDLFLDQCAIGLCGTGRCAQHHTGFMCDHCVDGSYKSLFSSCHPLLCKNKSIVLLVFYPFAAAIFVGILHLAIFFRPGAVMFFLSIAQLALVPILPYLDWSIPKTLPSLSEMLCGARMDAMQKSFVFAFGPLLAIPVLWTVWTVAYLLSICAGSKFRARGRSLHWGRLLLTTFALLYLCSASALYGSLNWLKCKKSVFGTYWSVSPSIDCDSEAFQSKRSLMLGLAFPLWMIPLGASFAFLVIRDAKKWPTAYGHRADILPSLRIVENLPILRVAFHFLNGYRSRWWSYIDLLILRLLIPILSTSLTYYGAAESSWTSLACAFAMVASTVFQPFLTRSMSFAATAALAGVACLAATQPSLSAQLTYPFIALGLVMVALLLLIIIFALGAPSVEKSQIENAWAEDEDQQLLDEDSMLM